MILAIDFDGTLVEHAYPKIGKEIPHAFETLEALQKAGHRLILWTYRDGSLLQEAVDYCEEKGIIFYAVNENFRGEKLSEGDSRLIKADIFIDDRNLGGLPNWLEVKEKLGQFTKLGVLQFGVEMSSRETCTEHVKIVIQSAVEGQTILIKLNFLLSLTFTIVNLYFVFILCCADNSYCVGITNNLERRINEHNEGEDKKAYTFKRRPVKILFHTEFNDVNEATSFEKKLKGLSRKKKEAIISGNWDLFPDLSNCKNHTRYDRPKNEQNN